MIIYAKFNKNSERFNRRILKNADFQQIIIIYISFTFLFGIILFIILHYTGIKHSKWIQIISNENLSR